MKRIMAAALACLLLPICPAHAKSVPAQVQAPARVQTQFLSKTGKTTININAPVIVPEAEAAYLIPVNAVEPQRDKLRELAQLILPDSKYKAYESDDPSIEGGRSQSYHLYAMINNNDRYEFTLGYRTTKAGAIYMAGYSFNNSVDFKRRSGSRISYSGYNGAFIEGDRIPGHKLSLTEAMETSESFLRKWTDEPFELFYVADSLGYISNDDMILAGTNNQGHSYKMIYTRITEDMPVLSSYHSISFESAASYAHPIDYESIQIALDADGNISAVQWKNPSMIGDSKEEQTLLPFEQILEIASHILPLKLASGEAQDTVQADIHTIRLGYMPVLQRSLADTFMLTPVWNFYGIDAADLAQYPEHTDLNMAVLTVNAVNGTVIDLEYGY